ncbi:MAG: ATP synthase F1 subunit epsilon [Firmicutes bacterium HGW-Firmicutes-15]|nr:MAG: ATP synthase F1 subunit epsilon [Firmicutes bacterium HGW-Firmicutes-15]
MADSTFMLEIVTPEELLFKDEIQFVVVPEVNGEMGVLRNHAPLIAALNVGIMRYTDNNGAIKKVAISGGFMEVMSNEARILAETAERGSQIDVLRAKASKDRAEKRLSEHDASINQVRAQMSLARATARLKASDAS